MKIQTNIKVEILNTPITIDNLDISIEIEKTIETKPNTCKCIIYNLKDNTNDTIINNATGAKISVSTSSEENYLLIFDGDLEKPKETKSGKKRKSKRNISVQSDSPDKETILLLQDGFKTSFFITPFKKSYEGYITNNNIVSDILNHLRENSVPIGKVDSLNEITFNNGKSFLESPINILKKLCSNGNCELIIENGVVSIVNKSSSKTKSYIKLNSNNCPSPDMKNDGYVTLDTPLLPTLNPGDYVDLTFDRVNGLYKIYKIKHVFDNFGGENSSQITFKEE